MTAIDVIKSALIFLEKGMLNFEGVNIRKKSDSQFSPPEFEYFPKIKDIPMYKITDDYIFNAEVIDFWKFEGNLDILVK